MNELSNRGQADATIAVCKCGSVVLVVVSDFINHSRSCKKDLMAAVQSGCDIKHAEVQQVRKMPFGCKCEKVVSPQKTGDLFGNVA